MMNIDINGLFLLHKEGWIWMLDTLKCKYSGKSRLQYCHNVKCAYM